jgi:hypothetical protein
VPFLKNCERIFIGKLHVNNVMETEHLCHPPFTLYLVPFPIRHKVIGNVNLFFADIW